MDDYRQRIKLIMTKEQQNRIRFRKTKVQVDLHGMDRVSADKFLKNLIALNRSEFTLEIIHGYHHGTVLKEMVNSTLENTRILARKAGVSNPGITDLTIAAAA